jgi:peptidoglycan/LPS O-acetylase OafA/YrhL
MFGYLRFILAIMVVLSHTGVSFFTLSPGVTAVVVFYILAGFVVSHIYNDILPNTNYKLLHFYKDRLLRIFPLYIYVSVLTLIFITLTSYSNPSYTLTAVVGNALIIPLNYFMYADFTILKDLSAPWCLIPPAWSLGTELQAYLLLALGIRFKLFNYFFIILSLVIYTIANLSILHPDYFGYRFIIGVYFIFAAGVALQRASTSASQRYTLIFIYATILIIAAVFTIKNSFSPTYTRETLIGLLVGIPLVYGVSKVKQKLPLNALLGSLSYGIFLSHFLSFWILDYIGITKSHSYGYLLFVILISSLISLVGILFVEKRVNKVRNIR